MSFEFVRDFERMPHIALPAVENTEGSEGSEGSEGCLVAPCDCDDRPREHRAERNWRRVLTAVLSRCVSPTARSDYSTPRRLLLRDADCVCVCLHDLVLSSFVEFSSDLGVFLVPLRMLPN